MAINITLLCILAISLFVRLWGIQNNLPYIENADELSIGKCAVNIAKTGDISKYYTLYPPFHTYLQALIIFLYSAIKWCSIESLSRAETYLVFRIVVAILGTIGVFATYLLGKAVGNKTTGVISAALLGGTFVHAIYSSQVKNDVPEALLGTLAIFFSVQFINRSKRKDLFFAAFFAALAFSTHYFGIFFVVPVGVAYFLNLFDNKDKLNPRHLLFLGSVLLAGFILGFFVGSPIYLFEPSQFFQMLSASLEFFEHEPISEHGLFSKHGLLPGPGGAFYAKYLWHSGLYYPLFLISALGIIFCLIKRTKGYICILSFLFVYGMVLLSGKLYHTDRLTIPSTPVLAVASAVFLTYLYEKFKEINLFSAQWLPKYLGVTLLVALLAILYARIGIGDYYLARPSSLHQLEEWMDSHVPGGSRVLFTATPLCFSPNDLEEKYAVSYYLPELSRRPLGSLATRFDYVILYWAGHLPTEWVKEIKGKATLKVRYLPPKTVADWLNPITASGSLRGGIAEPVSLYYLGDIPLTDCVVVTNVLFTGDTCKGNFQFTKGDKPADDKIEVVYSTPLFLADAEGVEKEVAEDFKSFKGCVNYNFVWEAKEGRIRLYELRTDGTQVEINYNLAKYQHLMKGFRDNLYKQFNLDNLISGEFLGQDGKDYCSLGGFIKPSGHEDIHIRVTGAKKSVKRVKVTREETTWMGPFNGAYPPVYLVQDGEVVECYFEPCGDSGGRVFEISLIYEDGTVAIAQTYGIATGPDVATRRDGDRIVVHKLDSDTVELYDLASDPAQEKNLVADDPEKAEELKKKYFSLKARTGESIEVVSIDQDGSDLVGTHTEGASGRDDIHIRLRCPKRPIRRIRVDMDKITWVGPIDGIHYCAKFVQDRGKVNIYIDPVTVGGQIKVTAFFEDGLYATATSDKGDP